MANIRDVARQAGVSTSTVSLAFGESDRVSAATAKRVWEAAEKLGYRPNSLAQSLKRGHSRFIGLVVGDISNPFFGRFLKAIERSALASGYHVIVSNTEADPQRDLEALDQLASQKVAGIILAPHGVSDTYVERIRSYETPIVTFDHKLPDIGIDFVGSDTRLAAAMLTEHLVNLGHRRIAQIAGPVHLWTAAERVGGYRDVLHGARIEPEDSLVVDGGYNDVKAYEQTMRLMTRAERPTAILAANNLMALGALQAIQELGFSCPNDISLATIDDVPWSAVIQPRLTMVRQDVDRIARLSLDYLLERMNARHAVAAPRETILTPHLAIGASTAPPPVGVGMAAADRTGRSEAACG